VIETFLRIEHVIDTSSSSLKQALDGMLSKHNLSIKKLARAKLRWSIKHERGIPRVAKKDIG